MTVNMTDYSHFKNKTELNEATRKHWKRGWNKINLTVHHVLELIWRHSTRFGAAHLSHGDISVEIQKAISTVKKSILKLEQFGVIFATARKDSVRIFTPFVLSTSFQPAWTIEFILKEKGVNLFI